MRRIINNRSFTLVELLIATSIMAMIGLAIAAVFATGLKVYSRIEAYKGPRQDVILCLERMERDLRNAFNFSKINFAGEDETVSFAGLVNFAGSRETKGPAPGRIYYYLDEVEDTLIREEQDYSQAMSEEKGRTGKGAVRELASIQELELSYFYYDEDLKMCEWKNRWGVDDKEEEKKLPLGVRVELTFKENGKNVKLARTVFLPSAN